MQANENMHENYHCESCDYKCSKKFCWDQHISTAKHIKAINGLMQANKKYACETCDALFRHQSSWSRHKKKCEKSGGHDKPASSTIDKDELIIALLKQNAELLEIVKHGNSTTNSNINSLNNNKTFNLQFFLNETCKDAMNIMDFVDSIKLQLSDLEKVGELGYVEGISNIITSNLKALDVSLRPVHCTDKKRETIYVKDENKWTKEDDKKTKLRTAIKRVANKNINLLPQYREKYPDYGNADSKLSDKYCKMVIEAMGGNGKNDLEKEDKIIHNISKNVIIDKNQD